MQLGRGGARWGPTCELHARASSPSSPVPSCPWGGAHSPSSPTLGQPVLGLLGKCSLGGHEQDPSSSLSGVIRASPALGQDADPCHPTQPCQGHAPTSPGIRHSRHCGCRRNGGHHKAVTCVAWPVAGHVRVDQGGLDAGPAKGREGWELNTGHSLHGHGRASWTMHLGNLPQLAWRPRPRASWEGTRHINKAGSPPESK